MSTQTRTSAVDRLFDAVIERQASVYDAFRSATERNHRFTRSIIEGARQSNRDWTEVGRRFVTKPTDLIGVYEAISEAVGNQQSRALALSREWIEDVVEGQRESRDVMRQGIGDWREALESVQANAPTFLRRSAWSRRNNDKQPAQAAEK